MTASQVALFALSTILLVLATFVWRARPDHSVNRWFAAQTLCLASWVFGVGGLQGGTHLDAWGRFTFASASLIPPAFLGFTRCYPTPSQWPSIRLLRSTFIAGAILAFLSLATSLVTYDNVLTPEGLTRKSGPLHPVFATYFIITWVAALGVFIEKWRPARGLARAQLQHLGAGIIIAAAGGIGMNLVVPLVTGRSTHSWLGPYFSVIFVALVAHAIIRHRLMDLRVFINRGLAYTLGATILSAFLIAAARHAAPNWSTEPLLIHPDILIVVIVVLATLSAPSQRFFSRVIDPYLYRGRVDYASALRSATRQLSRLMPLAELSADLQQILSEAFVPEKFVMVVRRFESETFEQLTDNAAVVEMAKLAALMGEQPNPNVIIVNPALEAGARRIAHEALRTAGIEVVITLGRRGQELGAILLGPRRSGDAYFKNDLAFIESLAELASIALENALLYSQRIQILEYSNRLLESLDSAVVAVDVAGKITSLNPAAKDLLGLGEDKLGAQLDVLPSEIAWALAMEITGSWHARDVEATIDHATQGILHVILSTAVLHDDQKKVTGALAVVTDLSNVKALERNQRRVEHLAIMARFYAGIAHEIRNPLAAISNFISMLPDRFDDLEYRDTAVRLLPIEVARIVRLADRLRLMAPSEGGKLRAVALPPLLNDIVAIHSPAAQDQQVKIFLQCPEELPEIQGDPSQLVQLFVNLLRNAIEAMPHGGTVSIEAESLSTRTTTDRVIVRVIDEGPGIDPAVRAKIFEPFFTTKPAGTGLGLSICREIADFHRARLTLFPRTTFGGTVAEVEFPSHLPDPTR
ncbi:MAG: PAS domain-containing protein [Chloroflexi bacterium]|nr:MAG: PAS domain-containing protein [Chloroflexota bacterium]